MDATPLRLRAASAFLLLGPVVAAQCVAQPSVELATDDSSIVLTGNLRGPGKKQFRLAIDCLPSSASKSRTGDKPRYYLGTDGGSPRCVLSNLTLTIGGDVVHFPKRGIEDLANVTILGGVYLSSRAETVVLHIRGGDGTGSYKVRFMIEQNRAIAREIEQMNPAGELKVIRQDLSAK